MFATALHLQEASLTGESQAVVQGSGRALVTATGMDSEMGAIATLLDTTTADLVRMLLLGVSLAVAVVPEGLPAILSVVLAMGVQRMAGRQADPRRDDQLDDAGRQRIIADVGALSDTALRTLAVTYRPLGPDEDLVAAPEVLERDLVFVGTVGIIDPPRPEAAVAIREAHGAGIRVVMITGDHPRTAVRIAADLGLVGAGLLGLQGAGGAVVVPLRATQILWINLITEDVMARRPRQPTERVIDGQLWRAWPRSAWSWRC